MTRTSVHYYSTVCGCFCHHSQFNMSHTRSLPRDTAIVPHARAVPHPKLWLEVVGGVATLNARHVNSVGERIRRFTDEQTATVFDRQKFPETDNTMTNLGNKRRSIGPEDTAQACLTSGF